ncbi:MAG: hypothetical protein PUF49_03640 [Firmicutes bacterium]|nr:hypothetical protein [Bacillota bacterium]
MARKVKQPVHHVVMTDGKRAIIIKPNVSILNRKHSKHPTDELFQVKCVYDILLMKNQLLPGF